MFNLVLLTLALAFGSTIVSALPAVGPSPSEQEAFQPPNVGDIEIYARASQPLTHIAALTAGPEPQTYYIPTNITESKIPIPSKGWFTDHTKKNLWARWMQPSPKHLQRWLDSDVSEAQRDKVLMKKYHPYQGAAARRQNVAILLQNPKLRRAAHKDPRHELHQTARDVERHVKNLEKEPLPLYSGPEPPPPYPSASPRLSWPVAKQGQSFHASSNPHRWQPSFLHGLSWL